MKSNIKNVRRLVAAAGYVMASGIASGAMSVDDHGGAGVWWEMEACCQHWGSLDEDKAARLGFDEETGRSLLNYPPHRFADHIHMKLEVRIGDMNTPMLEAKQTLTLAALGMELPEFTLNCGPASSMRITSVTLAGGDGTRRATFSHEGEELRIQLDPPAPVGERFDVAVEYTLTDPPEGMTWTPEAPSWPGRAAQLHTQGQPESNRYWFPCHDFPNERLTTEIIATVPAGYTVVSNGKLVEKSSGSGTDTFHWLQDKEHVNYLVTLVVGKFDVVDVGTSKVPMPVYAPVGMGDRVQQTYGRTKTMTQKFETILDEPYPWDKYAQVVVHNFAAGGMENTSATTMYDTAVLDRTALLDGDLDGLIAHELAHQWFGDLITCNSWEHIWLNEGFATFFSHVWFEERDGIEAYMAGMYQTFRNVAANDRADAPYRPGMNSKEYSHPWEVFRRGANPYPKGASILHMLRARFGDKLFLKALRDYVDRAKGKTVETDDLRYVFEEVTGESLDRFFRQWCTRPGIPVVDVSVEWDSGESKLTLNLKQVQNIDGANPAFFFTLPVTVQMRDKSRSVRVSIDMDSREVSKSFQLSSEPDLVAINDDLSVLADLRITQSASRWVTQLERGPTSAAKMQAVDALKALAEQDATALPRDAADGIWSVVRSGQHHSLRRHAAGALLPIGGIDPYLRAMRQLPDDARVRIGLVESAADAHKQIATRGDNTPARLMDDLRQLARRDPSYGVRAAAIRQLGQIGGAEGRSVIVEALEVESQHDQIRRAALHALAELDDASGLELALRYTRAGVPARTRPDAVEVVGKLAHHDRAAAVQALVTLLGDSESRTARAAGEALTRLGGADATQAIEAYSVSAGGAAARATAAGWMRKLRAKDLEAEKSDGVQ